ncbi:hypothetical protein M8818_005269 [Zalaria obscura]|uniref:Uncharacterized protein n=1 Tax=Zalaria obscura TaxID=2024903 RepID=A0ACC3SA71_9PEZI
MAVGDPYAPSPPRDHPPPRRPNGPTNQPGNATRPTGTDRIPADADDCCGFHGGQAGLDNGVGTVGGSFAGGLDGVLG